jgi:hypothetical protein
MFGSNDNFFKGVSLRDAYNVASSSLVENRTDSSVVSPVRHPLLNARFYLNNNLTPRLILIEQFAETQLTTLSGFFCHETTRTRTISF